MNGSKITIKDLQDKKAKHEKITMLTAYECSMASLLDEAGIDMVLVGDSVGMVMLGYDSTVSVTMDEMLHHAKAVTRVVKNAFVVADIPLEGFDVSIDKLIENAAKFLKEARCDAVKVEGGEEIAGKVKALVSEDIPVLGHIGLTPQTASKLGGYKVQGKDVETAKYLIRSGYILEEAGCFGVVLECVPGRLSSIITENLKIPTIGIGAGACCDGQVLVTHDLVGMFDKFKPKFVKQYANINKTIREAILKYKQEVIEGVFPSSEHEFLIPRDTLEQIKKIITAR